MKFIPVILAALLVSACGDTIVNVPTQPSAVVTPTPTVVTTRIGFRVSGNASSVRIRYSTERDGLVQTVSTLPYFTSFNTTADNLFLSLEVTPISYSVFQFPFLSAQITADGNLFREATSNEFLLNTLTVSGTWRR